MLRFISEIMDPNQPFSKNDYIKEWTENPHMCKVPVFGLVDENDRQDDNAKDIYTMNDQDGNRNVPEFVFPGTGKEQEKDEDLEELF